MMATDSGTEVEKGLLMLVASDTPGLQVRFVAPWIRHTRNAYPLAIVVQMIVVDGH